MPDNTDGCDHETPHRQVLDLFCGPGGAARGFQRLGYQVVGVDIQPQPHYPGEFVQADLQDGLPDRVAGREYAAVWASPPCDFAVRIEAFQSGDNLIPLARQLVQQVDAPIRIIENVPGAREHLRDPVALEGGAFGLGVKKRRYFETNFRAESQKAPGADYEFVLFDQEAPVEGFREAHGFRADSALTTKELRPAIPPAYVRYLFARAQANGTSRQAVIA